MVQFYSGASRAGRQVKARQAAGGEPVQPWGAVSPYGGLEVRVHATYPEGRGLVRLQLQAAPAGVAFGQPGTVTRTATGWVGTGRAAILAGTR